MCVKFHVEAVSDPTELGSFGVNMYAMKTMSKKQQVFILWLVI